MNPLVLDDEAVKYFSLAPFSNGKSRAKTLDHERNALYIGRNNRILEAPYLWEGIHARQLIQHPLLALSREIRADCILAYYHFNHFGACFRLNMGKFDMLELAYAVGLLSLDPLRALFARAIPFNPLFDGMQFDCDYGDSTTRLSI